MAFLIPRVRARACAILLGAVFAAAASSAETPRALLERSITDAQARAGFIYNCAMFVEWPASALGEEFVIAVVGNDQTAAVLPELQGKKVNGRAVRVRSAETDVDLKGVQIVYVPGNDDRLVDAVLQRVGTAPVLTVSDHDNFTTSHGGIVRLFMDQSRLRFEINMTSVERAGLKISAKMLGLARIVR
jgi:hypothetical protein